MLFRGGLRDADVLLAEFDAVGLGVEDILMAVSSAAMSDMFSCPFSDMFLDIYPTSAYQNWMTRVCEVALSIYLRFKGVTVVVLR